ncbi:MAG: EAL domain-containing protein [Clostridiales bacterium]|nr:EAL domain-containing protein [Clostridiales bacterium]
MDFTIFLEFIENISMFTMLILFVIIISNKLSIKQSIKNVIFGIFFSMIAIFSMHLSNVFTDEVMYDARYIIISFSGFLGGPISGIITIITSSLFTMYLGGVGVLANIIGIILSGAFGIFLSFFKSETKRDFLYFSFYGVLLSIICVSIFFIIPLPKEDIKTLTLQVLSTIPITTIFATIIIGTVMEHENNLRRVIKKIHIEKEQNEFLAYNDKLTGLPNRASVLKNISNLISKKVSFHIAFIDLDGFKLINDTHGHLIGDEILIAFANQLSLGITGKNAYCGRIGGDEFVLVLIGHSAKECDEFFTSFIKILKKTYKLSKITTKINASIGIAKYPEDAKDMSTILKCADIVMYQSKKTYGTNYMYYEKDMYINFERKVKIEEYLKTSDIESEFSIHLQPYFIAKNPIPVGFEAFLRWKHPILGYIPPSEFIPIAESIGYFENLGRYVIDRACYSINKLQLAHNREYSISINTSSCELLSIGYVEFLIDTIRKYNLKNSQVELEISESIISQKSDVVIEKLEMLQHEKIMISLDNFGIELSAIQILRELSFDTVKIGRSFVYLAQNSQIDKQILSGILSTINIFDSKIVAKGIENEEQYKNITHNDVDYIQGYYTGYPEDLSSLINKYRSLDKEL